MPAASPCSPSAILWIAAAHLLAAARGRPAAAAHPGLGAPLQPHALLGLLELHVRLARVRRLVRPDERTPRARRRMAAPRWGSSPPSVALYFSHALWFAAGTLWFFVSQALSIAPASAPRRSRFLSFVARPDRRGHLVPEPRRARLRLVDALVHRRRRVAALRLLARPSAILGGLRGPAEPLILAAAARMGRARPRTSIGTLAGHGGGPRAAAGRGAARRASSLLVA